MAQIIPSSDSWPVDPQEDVPINNDRIWVDGCFDFTHHGHAGAMLQSRRLGNELVVGIHSDQAILENKGPTVMNLKERCTAVEACRWVTKIIPSAPYVTSLPWISHYGCKYVVHGDDITSDSNGEDCYRFVKEAGRFKIVKRTPGISTTDLVGRMLLCTRKHFIKSLTNVLNGKEGDGGEEERKRLGNEMQSRIREYATDESGHKPLIQVWNYDKKLYSLAEGQSPHPDQIVVYVDGGFDLFTPGHVDFLRCVVETEANQAGDRGWYDESRRQQRINQCGRDYLPIYVVVGIFDDFTQNSRRGVNYPIMNIYERGLCVLQCKYVSALIFSAPSSPNQEFLDDLPYEVAHVYHGPSISGTANHGTYDDVKAKGIYREIGLHAFSDINATTIVDRIMKSRQMYEERQRAKGFKVIGEEQIKSNEVNR